MDCESEERYLENRAMPSTVIYTPYPSAEQVAAKLGLSRTRALRIDDLMDSIQNGHVVRRKRFFFGGEEKGRTEKSKVATLFDNGETAKGAG